MSGDKLRAAILEADAAGMSTEALVEHCLRAVPGCTPPEIMAAMRQLAEQQIREAEELERFGRCRKAGITAVHEGGKPWRRFGNPYWMNHPVSPKPAPPPADAMTRLRQDLDRALAALARLERRR